MRCCCSLLSCRLWVYKVCSRSLLCTEELVHSAWAVAAYHSQQHQGGIVRMDRMDRMDGTNAETVEKYLIRNPSYSWLYTFMVKCKIHHLYGSPSIWLTTTKYQNQHRNTLDPVSMPAAKAERPRKDIKLIVQRAVKFRCYFVLYANVARSRE